jgi:hypothetical protein
MCASKSKGCPWPRRDPENLDGIPSGSVVHFEGELVADGM